MNCSDAMELLSHAYTIGQTTTNDLPDEVIAHFASCPTCLDDLAALGMAFTGEMSPFLAALTTQSNPGMATVQPMPPVLTFAEKWRRDHLWQVVAATVHQLVAEITIRVGQTTAFFDALPALLQPQLAPVPVQRSKTVGANPAAPPKPAELLELPHPEANLLIRVNMAAVVAGKGALVLEVRQITPAQPIAQAKVTLRDPAGDLLERKATDADGLALFADLAMAKYTLVVEQDGQSWRLGLTLSAAS